MVLMEWRPEKYATGVDEMDEQHKRLFEIGNKLHDAMKSGKGSDEIGTVLRELQEYTEEHFSDEEEFLEECGYAGDCPGCFDDHQDAHAEFVSEVNALVEKHESSQSTGLTIETMNFIRDWLTGHITDPDVDQDYGEYYRTEVDAE